MTSATDTKETTKMDTNMITQLAQHVEDIATTDGGNIIAVTIGAMADGSHRSYALITTEQNGLEQEYRVTSPAPFNSPAWAAVYRDFEIEVRTGETWLSLIQYA